MSYLTGIPVANASKVITTSYNTVITIYNDVIAPKTGNYLKHWTTYRSDTGGFDGMYEAMLRGNQSRVENLEMELRASGADDKKITSEIRKRVRDDYMNSDISEVKATTILMELGYGESEIQKLLNDWRFRRDTTVEEPTSAMANNYYDTFRSMGLTATDFAKYYSELEGAHATDRMSLGEVRRQYISTLNVTESVKAALWDIWYDSEW